ncbi:hypothetical protein N7532_009073 [Penicillium argentinense]|uniref:Uncharacterized protein n=1 Tax=Penicillium argentinense TaxID=1131581 RepID=A0A9W9K267_9EURO|nr:uncharacterized protein N7532_009073 [Penicillium argentinense]KAJ5090389.1 hypothetical protein N7532_009073 [Penicillium argentinense]
MKLLYTIILGLLPLALAAQSLKSVIVTFPKGTPARVIDQAKDSLVASGGVITHEYLRLSQSMALINPRTNVLSSGFAAEAPATALETISTQSEEYKPIIEEDQVVSANGN